jgi:hypothetical protein
MKFIGYISREMIHGQNLNMMGPCGTKIKLPLTGLDAMDLYTIVHFDEDSQQVVLESLKAKRQRYNGLYKQFVKESYANQAIVNI